MSIEQDIDQAYEVIEWVAASMRKVASNPRMLGKFLFEYSKRLPDIVDAVMTILPPEHRGVAAGLLKASGEMSTKVLLWQAKKK